MSKPEFTDAELSFINVLCVKADPMDVIDQAFSIKAKITAYAQEKQKQKAEKPSKRLKKKEA